jgi:AGZA family xanthine/uracil permease-like MFS transporter
VVASPDFSTFGAPFQSVGGSLAITQIFTPVLLMALFAIMLTDFFDTMGTVVAVGEQAGFVGKDGNVPGIRGILGVDSVAAAVGGLFGASSITTYIESAAGVAEGGRTGLTSTVTAVLFAVGAFFAPIVAMVGGGYTIPNGTQYSLLVGSGFAAPEGAYYVYPITAGALIVVGFLMMRTVRDIPWMDFEEAFPAFLIIVGIPLTYNISYGIGFGFISHTLIKLFHRKAREIHPFMYVVSVAFAFTFVLPWVQSLVK